MLDVHRNGEYSVSVIIPCYNSSKFIRKTIESVVDQNFEFLEIIAVDDGSKDETRTILEGYLPTLKIKILSHPNHANLGQGPSFNLAIRESKSNLIAFLDSDDLWYPCKVREQVKIFQRFPDVGLVYTNGYVIDDQDNILYKLFPDNHREENITGKILRKCYIRSPSLVMVRREMFTKTGLFQSYRHAIDHDMWVRMSEITKFYYIPEFLSAYRKHKSQRSFRRAMWECGFDVLRDACNRYSYGGHLKRKRLAVLHYRLAQYDWRHRDFSRALKEFCLGVLELFKAIVFSLNQIGVRTFNSRVKLDNE